MKQLRIGQPYVVHDNKTSRLEAMISFEDFQKPLYYEVDEKYGQYLCYERSDAFIIGLMYFAMVEGYDISCEAPLSEKLYHQLTMTYIPTMAKNDPELFRTINIYAKLDGTSINSVGGVAASVSGGVDSFYTIIKNLNTKAIDYNITHLLLTNCFNIYFDEADTRRKFTQICEHGEKIAKDMNLEFIKIYTNEHIFWYPHYVDLYCMRFCALPFAIQKLISVYNYSTGYQYKAFTFKAENRDASHYDFFTVHLISSENLTVYSSGGEVSRAEKAAYIADNKTVQKYLQVCNLQHDNCGICEKCLRTQLNLYSCGKLKKFDQVFNLDEFERNKDRAIAACIAKQGDFDKEILDMMKKNNVSISQNARIRGEIRHLGNVIKYATKRIGFVYKMIKTIRGSSIPKDIFYDSNKYNIDREFAKKCDPEIVCSQISQSH